MRGTKSPIDDVRSILCRSFFEGDVFGGVKQIVARYPAATMAVASTMELSDIMVKTGKRKGPFFAILGPPGLYLGLFEEQSG